MSGQRGSAMQESKPVSPFGKEAASTRTGEADFYITKEFCNSKASNSTLEKITF